VCGETASCGTTIPSQSTTASVDSIAAQAKPDEVNPDRALRRVDED
jgi:hypothetical protein